MTLITCFILTPSFAARLDLAFHSAAELPRPSRKFIHSGMLVPHVLCIRQRLLLSMGSLNFHVTNMLRNLCNRVNTRLKVAKVRR